MGFRNEVYKLTSLRSFRDDDKLNNYNYILITPAKNEDYSLPKLITSIKNQIKKPIAWFIIDDWSVDNTSRIINKASEEYSWIYPLSSELKNEDYDLEEHYSIICINGFNFARHFCKNNFIDYDYIALSDADTVYPKDYFYEIISFMNKFNEYGVVSGNMHIIGENGDIHPETSASVIEEPPLGTGRVWRKEAFDDTNGYIITKSPDSVSNAMMILRGWKIKRLDSLIFCQTRETASKLGLWNGYFNKGKRNYFVGSNLINLVGIVVHIILYSYGRHRITKSVAFFCGYFNSYLRRDERINNDEIRKYFGSYRNVFKKYISFIEYLMSKYR